MVRYLSPVLSTKGRLTNRVAIQECITVSLYSVGKVYMVLPEFFFKTLGTKYSHVKFNSTLSCILNRGLEHHNKTLRIQVDIK